MNMKFSIGVVVAVVLQVSAFVWWTAQQAQNITSLTEEVADLTSRMALEEQVNLKRDIADMKAALEEHDKWIDENYQDIRALIEFAMFTENKWADAYANDDSYERKFGSKPPRD